MRLKLCNRKNGLATSGVGSIHSDKYWDVVVGEELAYLGATFVPFALKWTSSQVGGRSTTFGCGLPDCFVCHGGRAGVMPSTGFLRLVIERRVEEEGWARPRDWRGV